MTATTEAKRETIHHSGGGEHRRKPYGFLVIGGAVFLTAWLIWTFWFSSAIH